MKKLLFIILIIALPVMVQGQWYEGVKIGESIITDSVKPPKPMHDTLPVIMLVCDTAKHDTGKRSVVWNYPEGQLRAELDSSDIINRAKNLDRVPDSISTIYTISDDVFWLRGYEVRKYSFYLDSYTHVAYLDSNKQPVKYLVWMSKEVGK